MKVEAAIVTALLLLLLDTSPSSHSARPACRAARLKSTGERTKQQFDRMVENVKGKKYENRRHLSIYLLNIE